MTSSSAIESTRIEMAVVAFCVSDAKALGDALTAGITPATFSDAVIADAFAALIEEDRAGRSLSLPAVSMRHPRLARALAEYSNLAPIAVEADAYFRELLAQCWQRRAWSELGRLATMIGRREAWEPLSEFQAQVTDSLTKLLGSETQRGPVPIAKCLDDCMQEIERVVAEFAAGKAPGIPTGFAALDVLTGGFAPGTVNIAAARTSRGKTTLALNFLHTAAKAGYSCAYFSVEMQRGELTQKLLSLSSAVSGTRIRIGELSQEQQLRLADSQADLGQRLIWIDDSTNASFEAFEHSCRALKRRGSLDLVCIDYVQQFHPSGRFNSVHERIAVVSRRLKQLAFDLKIAVIALAQLNRQAEGADGQPDIWHIKDSGSIEQDADLILLIHSDNNDSCRLYVGKNRHGKDRMHIPVEFKPAASLFRDLTVNLEAFQ